MATSRNCGYLTHAKGEKKVKGYDSFVKAVEFAKKQTAATAVLSICGGQVKRLAVCANGGCGGGLRGVRGRRRARAKVRGVRATKRRERRRRRS
jgi:hypothetical protein